MVCEAEHLILLYVSVSKIEFSFTSYFFENLDNL